jgi:hypothetical protein
MFKLSILDHLLALTKPKMIHNNRSMTNSTSAYLPHFCTFLLLEPTILVGLPDLVQHSSIQPGGTHPIPESATIFPHSVSILGVHWTHPAQPLKHLFHPTMDFLSSPIVGAHEVGKVAIISISFYFHKKIEVHTVTRSVRSFSV